MATRFYLPASGTAPLGSLAVDASWARSDNLERRPMDTIKSNTSLTQKSATWPITTTNDWVWVQFQSKRLAAGYSWTTADTVSMVLKVAEAAAQVDSHLAYCIRVVSADGSTVRGTIGVYQATSTEYPTTLATIATRIHDARVNGASNFSSQAGDRIIIEIGHWGVTPTANVVYHNYGDPSAEADYALTADLDTDLCPWVELSRDVSFDLRSRKGAFLTGRDTAKSSQPVYSEGSNPSFPAKSSKPAFISSRAIGQSNKTSYLLGSINALSKVLSFLKGGVLFSDNQPSYLQGMSVLAGNKPSYLKGRLDGTSLVYAYLSGKSLLSDNQPVYLVGGIIASGNKASYLEGYSLGGSPTDFKAAFLIGIENPLVPDSLIGNTGIWLNQVNGSSNLWQSIDETGQPIDSDYIYNIGPMSDDYIEFGLSNPTGTPGEGDVVIFWRGRDYTNTGQSRATIELRQGAVVIASSQQILSSVQTTYYFALTPAEKANISNWNDLRVRIKVTVL